jgi:hypothetical protein
VILGSGEAVVFTPEDGLIEDGNIEASFFPDVFP